MNDRQFRQRLAEIMAKKRKEAEELARKPPAAVQRPNAKKTRSA